MLIPYAFTTRPSVRLDFRKFDTYYDGYIYIVGPLESNPVWCAVGDESRLDATSVGSIFDCPVHFISSNGYRCLRVGTSHFDLANHPAICNRLEYLCNLHL